MKRKLIYFFTPIALLATPHLASAQWAGTNPISTNSKVGIGTTTPGAKLEVKNTSLNDPCFRVIRAIPFLASLSTNTFEVIDGDPSTSPPTTPRRLFWIDPGENVGIGTLKSSGHKLLMADANGLVKSSLFTLYSNPSAGSGTDMNSIMGIVHLQLASAQDNVSNGGRISGGINNGVFISKLGVGQDAAIGYDIRTYNILCNSISYVSDRNKKENIKPIATVPSGLYDIKSYTYNFKKEKDRPADDKEHFGFIAQEVEQVFPNLVSVSEKGDYALNYTEFIPLLLTALKDQKSEIEALKQEVSSLKANQASASAIISKTTSILYQNAPNPFSEATVIRFKVAPEVSRSFICIYDLNGRQVQKLDIQNGASSISVHAQSLQPGTYLYSLFTDGQLVDTKKMVVL
ncbi:MAG: hypothetical protein BGO31_20555 [Bacteroidetes bacterium 43-16]|nr:MAG: hypothetical protein BGO31_20555 [Bacteroidetes bacterium 43-16]